VAGIVDKDVDLTQFALDALEGRLESVTVGHVDVHGQSVTTERRQFVKDPFVLVIVSAKHGDGRTRFGQSHRDGATDSAVPAGDDSDSTRQVEQCASVHMCSSEVTGTGLKEVFAGAAFRHCDLEFLIDTTSRTDR
jgi:hypothetical protein